jgi:hypothetical protein
MLWGIEVPEFGRLVSAVTCCGGIEVPETGRFVFCDSGRSTSRWKTTNPEFFTHACPNACCLSENVYEIKLDIPNSMN